MDTIGEKIKFIRHEKRLTQESLGELLGFSKQIVSSYENNISKPNYEFLAKLYNLCNVNLNWFITGIGEPFNPPQFEEVQDELTQKVEGLLRKYKLIP